jgi:molybdate transport system substrate-binding protein
LALVVLAVGIAVTPWLRAQADEPLVLAAASLKNAFDQVALDWNAETGKTVTISYAATSSLARQIEQGAPADIFASADLAWMNHLQEKGLIKLGTRTDLLGNTLVLVAPADAAQSFTLRKGADLGGYIGEGRLAVANVDSVPAGKYAKEALQALDMWPGVANKLALNDNVRSTLALVARGEAVAGIVYATDAAIEPKVVVLGTFPADSHTPIIYPVTQLASSKSPDAEAFLAFLRSPAAAQAYERYGFTLLKD